MAGIAAGYGVDANGKTFSKDYSTLSTEQVRTMSISPGSAPGVRLSALRVFGCSGSSLVSGQALDRCLTLTTMATFSDGASIVNLSFASYYSTADDPENAMLQRLIDKGMLAVVAAGNAQTNLGNGDVYSYSGFARKHTRGADGGKCGAAVWGCYSGCGVLPWD